jgi:hypothetical protein
VPFGSSRSQTFQTEYHRSPKKTCDLWHEDDGPVMFLGCKGELDCGFGVPTLAFGRQCNRGYGGRTYHLTVRSTRRIPKPLILVIVAMPTSPTSTRIEALLQDIVQARAAARRMAKFSTQATRTSRRGVHFTSWGV